ncbi:MAG: hypothetical protein II688_04430, partial [Lachnospiraceae bacterium]|nr:hypothetical protein [Lachnospiraceae bacterium]
GTIAYGTSFTLRRVFKRIDERMNDEGGEETVKKEAVRKETPAPAKRNIAAIAGRKLSNIEEEKKEE